MNQLELDRLENIRKVYGGEYTLRFRIYLKIRNLLKRRSKENA